MSASVELTITGLHNMQQTVATSQARFRVLCAGRRSGKTRLAVALALARAVAGKRVWWVAPSYKQGAIGWRQMRVWANRIPGAQMRLVDKRFEFPSGGWLEVRTAGAPGLLRGEGLDFVVFDECAQAQEESWSAEIRPALSDRKGHALFISTPRGRANWFYSLWLRGQSDESGEWASWQFPSACNPFLDPDEIEAAQNEMTQAVFDQEYLAEFNDAGDSPFNGDDILAMPDGWHGLQAPVAGRRYITAWDIGRKRDATVGVTLDVTTAPFQIVAYDRQLRMPYPAIQGLIDERARRYPGKTVVESNGPGDPVIGNLSVPAIDHVQTGRSKADALTALAFLLETGNVKGDVPQLTRELRAYAWNDKGLVQDSVMALAIAAYHAPRPGRQAISIDLGDDGWRLSQVPEMAGVRDHAW